MLVTAELLRAFPCLKPLPTTTLTELARQASIQRFARRAVVLHAGSHEHALCFLFEGHLQGVDFTIDGREVGLFFVEPGDFCGELALFDDGPQPEFVIARTAATTVFVPLEAMRQASSQHASLVSVLAARLAARVRQMTKQRSLLGLPNVAQRVCCQLWMLVPPPEQVKDHTTLANPPTHMEMAIMLNLTRESVSRVFQALQSRNIVTRDGPGCLIINDNRSLQSYAEGTAQLLGKS